MRLYELNPRIPYGTRLFCAAWMRAAIDDPRGVTAQPAIRTMIRERERQKQGGLARLTNQRPLERWSGESGLGRLTYRWGNAKTILIDILDGLRRAEA